MIGGDSEAYSLREAQNDGIGAKNPRRRAARLDLYHYWLAGATTAPWR
jgi:hypothetical protein